MPIQTAGVVSNPGTTNLPDGPASYVGQGKQAEQYVGNVHGRYYARTLKEALQLAFQGPDFFTATGKLIGTQSVCLAVCKRRKRSHSRGSLRRTSNQTS